MKNLSDKFVKRLDEAIAEEERNDKRRQMLVRLSGIASNCENKMLMELIHTELTIIDLDKDSRRQSLYDLASQEAKKLYG